VAEPAGFARALDAGSVARTAYDRLSGSRKREHALAIESVKAETCVRRIEKAPAMLRYQESAGGRAARAKPCVTAPAPGESCPPGVGTVVDCGDPM
jgi:hypothetical protein